MNNLETLVRTLPPELQTKVEDFVLFLIHKRQQPSKRNQCQHSIGQVAYVTNIRHLLSYSMRLAVVNSL